MRALVVDDEKPARERMKRLLRAQTDVEVVGEAGDGVTALEQVARLEPDVLLLDIEMPRLGGLGVAEALPRGGPKVVFVTAYDEHALRAFEAAAVDYLVKPVREARLGEALDRVRASVAGPAAGELQRLVQRLGVGGPARRVALKCGYQYVVVDPARVPLVTSQDHYAVVRAGGEEVLCDEPLDVLLERLGPGRFLRVHRSALVNLEWLASLEREGDRKYVAVLSDAERSRVPIARDRLSDVKLALGVG